MYLMSTTRSVILNHSRNGLMQSRVKAVVYFMKKKINNFYFKVTAVNLPQLKVN